MLSSTVIGEVIHPRSKLAGYSTGNNKGFYERVCGCTHGIMVIDSVMTKFGNVEFLSPLYCTLTYKAYDFILFSGLCEAYAFFTSKSIR